MSALHSCRRCGGQVHPEEAGPHSDIHRWCAEAEESKKHGARLVNVRAVSVEAMPAFRAVAQVRLAASHLAQAMTHMGRARGHLTELLGASSLDVTAPQLALGAHALDVAVMRAHLERAAQDLEHEAETMAMKGGTT
jgi:hypothetical protein